MSQVKTEGKDHTFRLSCLSGSGPETTVYPPDEMVKVRHPTSPSYIPRPLKSPLLRRSPSNTNGSRTTSSEVVRILIPVRGQGRRR